MYLFILILIKILRDIGLKRKREGPFILGVKMYAK